MKIDNLLSAAPRTIQAMGLNEIHIWLLSLDKNVAQVEQLRALLSADEQMRADRFLSEKDRNRFIVGRSALRSLLGNYLGIHPVKVQFIYGNQGKPALATSCNTLDIKFNISHSASIAIIAITINRNVGIDIERIRNLPEAEQIAEQVFSRSENVTLSASPIAKKMEIFFKLWVRKEAYVKGCGTGLSVELADIDVTPHPSKSYRSMVSGMSFGHDSSWFIEGFEPISGYVAAVAAEAWQWNWTDCGFAQFTEFDQS